MDSWHPRFGLELETVCVLVKRDNQLHHENMDTWREIRVFRPLRGGCLVALTLCPYAWPCRKGFRCFMCGHVTVYNTLYQANPFCISPLGILILEIFTFFMMYYSIHFLQYLCEKHNQSKNKGKWRKFLHLVPFAVHSLHKVGALTAHGL